MAGLMDRLRGPDLLQRARRRLARAIDPPPQGHPIYLEYPVAPSARFGWDLPVHPQLDRIIGAGSGQYRQVLRQILGFADHLAAIPITSSEGSAPHWHNPFFFGLDAAALYGSLAANKPTRYVEIGSGYSTLFAARAIRDHDLPTHILSIDPAPRAEVAAVSDEIVRKPLERLDLSLFGKIEPGDVVFIDGSHMSFMGSDVTIAFIEILPKLPAGVLVHIHDVFLPWDYRPDWTNRYYSEQYLLAAMLLAEGSRYEIVLPAFYVYNHAELSSILSPLWDRIGLTGYETAGHSFWLRIR